MAIETNTSVDVQTLTPFKKFIMTIGNLPTSYLESMTYAELLMWFCNYLQETVIPAVNNNAEAVKEIQNWINTLDLQDEVDHKLDEMAEDGTLVSLIGEYLNLRPKNLVCVTKVSNGSSLDLVLSKSTDGINFSNILKLNGISIPTEHRNAGVNFTYVNGYFYVLTSIGYWYSKDLIDWSEMKTLGDGISGPYIYDNRLYFTRWDYTQTITNVIGNTTYPASIGYFDITFDGGDIVLGEETTLIYSSLSSSHIDATVVDYKDTRYLACKNEIESKIELYILNNDDSLTLTSFSHLGIGIEACKLIPSGNGLYIYADPYGLQTNYSSTTNVSYDRGLSVRMTAINNIGIVENGLLTAINSLYNYHPAFALIEDGEANFIIDSLDFAPIQVKPTLYYKQLTLNSSASNEVVSVINHPRPTFITGNTSNSVAYLRFTKIFEDKPLLIRFDPASGTVIHPGINVNDRNDNTSTDEIIRNKEVISAEVYNYSTKSVVFLPIEQYEYRRKLESLPTNQSILSSINVLFPKGNTVNYFIISGYGTDTSVNKLPSASNFFGEYYKQNQNFGYIILHRIGANVIEYQTTIANGSLGTWIQTQNH